MRHSAVTFGGEVAAAAEQGTEWDLVFASDMLSLADFRGLAPLSVRNPPAMMPFSTCSLENVTDL